MIFVLKRNDEKHFGLYDLGENGDLFPLPYYQGINGRLELSIINQIAKNLGAKKLILKF